MRIVLAEDEVLLREGLARLLTDAGFEVVGRAGDPAALLRLVDARRPELVLTDIKMPPTHSPMKASKPHARSAAATPTPACWCSRTTSSPATRCGCSRTSPKRSGYLL